MIDAPGPGRPGRSVGPQGVRLCAFGDAVLDVLVTLDRLTVADDDVPAEVVLCAGGQAANVAAWAVALGASGAVVSRVGSDPAGRLVRDLLAAQGVELLAPGDVGRTGAVTAIVTPDGRRTMASDRRATPTFR
nr:PfkB family carbohydrate kinase [Actinomycetota bacterium]